MTQQQVAAIRERLGTDSQVDQALDDLTRPIGALAAAGPEPVPPEEVAGGLLQAATASD